MRFTWSERKRGVNLKERGLDFTDAPRVFEGLTFSYEDDRRCLRIATLHNLGALGWCASPRRPYRV